MRLCAYIIYVYTVHAVQVKSSISCCVYFISHPARVLSSTRSSDRRASEMHNLRNRFIVARLNNVHEHYRRRMADISSCHVSICKPFCFPERFVIIAKRPRSQNRNYCGVRRGHSRQRSVKHARKTNIGNRSLRVVKNKQKSFWKNLKKNRTKKIASFWKKKQLLCSEKLKNCVLLLNPRTYPIPRSFSYDDTTSIYGLR